MNNRLAMCLVGPVDLALLEFKPQPELWTKLVAQLGRLPEFVNAGDRVINLCSREFAGFAVPAPYRQEAHSQPGFDASATISGHWTILLTAAHGSFLALLTTTFQYRGREFGWPDDMPFREFEAFAPLVDDVDAFLKRLDTILRRFAASPTADQFLIPPVLALDYPGAVAN